MQFLITKKKGFAVFVWIHIGFVIVKALCPLLDNTKKHIVFQICMSQWHFGMYKYSLANYSQLQNSLIHDNAYTNSPAVGLHSAYMDKWYPYGSWLLVADGNCLLAAAAFSCTCKFPFVLFVPADHWVLMLKFLYLQSQFLPSFHYYESILLGNHAAWDKPTKKDQEYDGTMGKSWCDEQTLTVQRERSVWSGGYKARMKYHLEPLFYIFMMKNKCINWMKNAGNLMGWWSNYFHFIGAPNGYRATHCSASYANVELISL